MKTQLRGPGPRVRPSSVRISGNGTARLSADLGITGPVTAQVDAKHKVVTLRNAEDGDVGALRTWKSNPSARSLCCSFYKVLSSLGMTAEETQGLYGAKVEKDSVVVDLKKKIQA